MGKQILGINIRNDAVSAVLIKNGIKENVVAACIHVPVSDENIETGITAAIKEIYRQADISEAVCVTALSADTISFRNAYLPFKDTTKIRQVLPFELEPTLPFPVDSQVIDFKPIKTAKPGSIMTASVDSEFLKSHIDNIGTHGLIPKTVTIGCYALAKLLADMADIPPNSILLDINDKDATVFVIASGKIAIIRSFSISDNSASYGEILAKQITRSLGVMEDQHIKGFLPEIILITGTGLSDKQPEHDLSALMSIPVRRIDLFNEIRLPILNDKPSNWAPEKMDSALALTISEAEGLDVINFRRGKFSVKTRWIAHKKELIKTGILAGLVLLAGIFYLGIDTYNLKIKSDRLDRQIYDVFKSTYPNAANKVKTPDMQYQMMKAETINLLQHTSGVGETSENIRVIDVINSISKEIAEESKVVFSQFVMGAGSVSITGTTDTFNTVNDIKTRIEKIPQFSKVTISSADSDRTDKQIKFKLQIQLGPDTAEQEPSS